MERKTHPGKNTVTAREGEKFLLKKSSFNLSAPGENLQQSPNTRVEAPSGMQSEEQPLKLSKVL